MPSVDGLRLLVCDPPRLTKAEVTDATTVVLTFSRPLDPLTIEPTAFSFEPALTVLAAALSDNRKTVTLTTETHAAPSYVVIVDAEVTDVLGEPVDSTADRLTFQTGTVAPVLAVLYCFETDATTYSGLPTVVAAGFTSVSALTRVGGEIATTIAGNGMQAGPVHGDGDGPKRAVRLGVADRDGLQPQSGFLLHLHVQRSGGTCIDEARCPSIEHRTDQDGHLAVRDLQCRGD